MSRFVIVGAGAVGGVVGARLHEAGADVLLVARGRHLEALRAKGLTVRRPDGERSLRLASAAAPAEISWRPPHDVVLLCTKVQDAASALAALRQAAGSAVPVVCLQNGVEGGRLALRLFDAVIGAMVVLPTSHLEPGLVVEHSAPLPGAIDLGALSPAAAGVTGEVAAALAAAGFSARTPPDLTRWQYGKLLSNLANAVHAVCGIEVAGTPAGVELVAAVRAEGEACLRAAGLDWAPAEELLARVTGVSPRLPGGKDTSASSSWQSLARGAGSIETDYLNGEIALLGRLHGVPTPLNARLQLLADRLSRERQPPGSVALEEVRLGSAP